MVRDPEQTLRAARQRWLADDHDASLDLFREALSQQPGDLRLAVEVANYLGMRFEVDEATELLQKCESQLAHNPAALYQIGLAFQRAYRPDHARRCFETASASAHSESLLKIVEWHERRGDLDAAFQTLDACRQEDQHAAFWRCRLQRRLGSLDEAIDGLQALLDKPGTCDAIRIAALYELAALYDAQDEGAAAIKAAESAKQLQHPQAAQHLRTMKSLAQIEANFVATATEAHFARWQTGSRHRRVALLTGSPRSGTTLMARMLGMHDQLVVSDEIEVYPTYLHRKMLAGKSGTNAAQILDELADAHVDRCRDLYWTWMSSATGEDLSRRCLLDKMPSTTFLIPAFRRLFPQAVVVMAIRDPRDVVISCFLRHLDLNPVSAMFSRLDLTVARCRAECRAWLELRKKLTPPWQEVRYEDLVRGDYSGLRGVHDALGLQWQDQFAEFHKSLETMPVRSPSYAQLREPISSHRIGRWELYREFLEPLLSTMADVVAALGYD